MLSVLLETGHRPNTSSNAHAVSRTQPGALLQAVVVFTKRTEDVTCRFSVLEFIFELRDLEAIETLWQAERNCVGEGEGTGAGKLVGGNACPTRYRQQEIA